MKVFAINGSPRINGNCSLMIERLFSHIRSSGITTEEFKLGGKSVRGCTSCMKCFENKDRKCIINDGIINHCVEKMAEADGIILASPTYFSNITAEMKAFIDRAGYVAIANKRLFNRKVGVALSSVYRAGSMNALDAMNHFFLISGMIVPGSKYWNMCYGLQPGDILNDEEGLKNLDALAENMVWLLEKLNK